MVANGRLLRALGPTSTSPRAGCSSRAKRLAIVLCPKRGELRRGTAGRLHGVSSLGALLPYTPLHYLLFDAASPRRAPAWLDEPQELDLVMTSANPGGEPLVIGNAEAVRRLAGIADAFVVHDRDIAVRCDDSVVRAGLGTGRSSCGARAATPRSISMPRRPAGARHRRRKLKNTVCHSTRGCEAFLSPHVGDLGRHAASGGGRGAPGEHPRGAADGRGP